MAQKAQDETKRDPEAAFRLLKRSMNAADHCR
jgi:hypothetical protein